MLSHNYKFDLDDVIIVPAQQSEISSRKTLMPLNIKDHIMTAPMDTVVDFENIKDFSPFATVVMSRYDGVKKYFDDINQYIDVCYYSGAIPSVSLNDFETIKLTDIAYLLNRKENDLPRFRLLIDIANGHMSKIKQIVERNIQQLKEYGIPAEKLDYIIIGNIANPETYREYCDTEGIDSVRLSIGSGSACTTSANVAVGYPMGSLIQECYNISLEYTKSPKIIADGGMKNYSDIIKALNLGADYIMIGSMLNKAVESCSKTYLWKFIRVPRWFAKYFLKSKFLRFYKKYRGMSTKEVQKSWGKKSLQTSEGISKLQRVEYTVSSWHDNLTDYVASAMSYSNRKSLKEFIGSANVVRITPSAFRRFNK